MIFLKYRNEARKDKKKKNWKFGNEIFSIKINETLVHS